MKNIKFLEAVKARKVFRDFFNFLKTKEGIEFLKNYSHRFDVDEIYWLMEGIKRTASLYTKDRQGVPRIVKIEY
jgi:hypothetical protein